MTASPKRFSRAFVVHEPLPLLPALLALKGWLTEQDHPAYIPPILRPVGPYLGVSEPEASGW
jgi:hypothetical protein